MKNACAALPRNPTKNEPSALLLRRWTEALQN
jgi:hypothetical protein